MSDTPKPGEYVAATGQTRVFRVRESYVYHESDTRLTAPLAVADVRAAADALVALADELETEYVEISHNTRLVIHPADADGPAWLTVQTKSSTARGWEDEYADPFTTGRLFDAYRAGLERGAK